MRRGSHLAWAAVAALSLVAAAASPASASDAAPASFSGTCQFGGPLTIPRPITIIPVLGAHFSYAGTGTCNGKLDGAATPTAAITVTFDNASTLFDTCELGPDFPLSGVATIAAGGATAAFDVTVYLVRVALAGPFTLTTPQRGLAAGVASFMPADAAAAVQQCAVAGVATATLSATLVTVSPLRGTHVTHAKAHHRRRARRARS